MNEETLTVDLNQEREVPERKPLLEALEDEEFHEEQIIAPKPEEVSLMQIDRILGKIGKLEASIEKNNKYLHDAKVFVEQINHRLDLLNS